MKLKQARQNFLRIIGHYLLHFAINVLCKSLKFNFANKKAIEEMEMQKKSFVLAFWHGSMLLPWYLFRNMNYAALTSQSKDGDLLAKILRQWNYNVVRGSSSQGGNVALGILIDFAKNNQSILLTPDGPRGPIHKFKAGAVITAKKSGLPLVLVAVGIKNKKILKSWDKFEIPKLFTEVNVFFSDPIFVDNNLDHDQISEVIANCELQLNELHDKANSFT
ncbi:MAG TPA: lysophospholipid acyltransferase family protein [Ignavibacteriaceae bacterium]|nr:lysophospholipid acyltransferase family protein [Ignavibacteriaceae bacterium]